MSENILTYVPTYIMNKFIGACLIGPSAMSHDLFARMEGSVCLLPSAWMPAIDAEYPGGLKSSDAPLPVDRVLEAKSRLHLTLCF